MRDGFLWLAVRMMKKQRLRTCSIFCGIALSGFLLRIFVNFGCYFWNQVYGSTSDAAEHDAIQWILVLLAGVQFVLIVICSVILLYNLCSLTYVQKKISMKSLISIGAMQKDIIFMTIIESSLLCSIAAPAGQAAAMAIWQCAGMKSGINWWLSAGIFGLLFIISNICGIQTVLYHKKFREKLGKRKWLCRRKSFYHYLFPCFMVKKYYQADRNQYTRILFTMIAAIVLYVPVSYFINTNISVQRFELDRKYGISYTYHPSDYKELITSFKEYNNLKNKTAVNTMLYVSMEGKADIQSDLLSNEFSDNLKKAGWNGGRVFQTDSKIYFLEDSYFEKYLQDAVSEPNVFPVDKSVVLVNRCKNRTLWKEGVDNLFWETSLLDAGAWGRVEVQNNQEVSNHAGQWKKETRSIKIYYGFDNENMSKGADENNEMSATMNQYICPNILYDELPEEMDFTGDVTVILPLSQLDVISHKIKEQWNVYVCGYFEDTNETVYEKLQQQMEKDCLGNLRNQRKIFQEWYDSMSDIHLAMRLICIVLFLIAVLNIFQMIIFQYIEHKSGLAVLWTLGQSEKNLFQIIIWETTCPFLAGMVVGISVSCFGVFQIELTK